MPTLPTPEDREQLLERLEELCRESGGRFVSASLVRDDESFFPEPWSPSPSSLHAVLSRWMAYAGMGGLAVQLEPASWHQPGTSLRLVELSDARALFAAADPRDGELHDRTTAMDRACLEVARAFRRRHGLDVKGSPYRGTERDAEEPSAALLAVTAAFLGFGLQVANATYRHAVRYRGGGGFAWMSSTGRGEVTNRAGVPLEHACFLLAVRAVVEGEDEQSARGYVEALGESQAESFEACVRELRPEATALRRRFGAEGAEPSSELASAAPAALSRQAAAELERRFDEAREPSAEQEVVFRVRRTAGSRYLLRGAAIAAVPAVLVGTTTSSPAIAVIGPLLGAGLGLALGLSTREDYCSEPECEASLPPRAERCLGCGGRIGGEIRRPEERLAARERLLGEGEADGRRE